MRILLTILLSLVTIFGFGQSVTAPEPKSFAKSTTGQDASGFSLNGFSSTATLLCAIGLPQASSGTTFYLSTTTGLTPASGYTMSGNKTRLAFTGTMANINNALATLKVNTNATAGNIQISVSATVNPTGYFYNPSNGHFYRPISTGATYSNAKLLSSQQTFKGQQGYLVTITSADEDAFIFANVPQASIWFALTDEIVEAQWRIDAGPEAGTLIKTSNGQTAGNIVGQYNNWAPGEPNNSGNEDYAVTKWGGGSQWNDLPNNFSCAYVVEFGTWTNPDDQTFTEFYSNSVIHSNGDVFRVQYTFNFTNLTASRFAIRTQSQSNNVWTPFSQNYTTLNNIGRADMSNQSDTIKIVGGISVNIDPGQVEYSYTNPNASWLNGDSRLLIDMRTFSNTVPSTISRAKILDAYDGPVTFLNSDATWAQYRVPSPLTKVTDGTSTYNTNIRNVNGWNTDYAFTSTISFSNQMVYKPQRVQFQNPIADSITSMLDRIVTVSDVYLAFKEFADGGGIFGGGSGTQFTSGIQFMNADVNGDGQFNEADCFKLLRHLLGQESLLTTNNLESFMKILPKSTYDVITKTNWQTYPNVTSDSYSGITLSSSQLLNAYILNTFWKGDVNLSHSPTQSATGNSANGVNSIASMAVKLNSTSLPTAYIVSEIKGDSLVAYIKFNPNTNSIVGTQFKINYDNTILKYTGTNFRTTGSPINFGTDKGSYINLGSINTSGELLDGTTEYRLVFKINKQIPNSLGLLSIASNEAVNSDGKGIIIKIQ
jgi:hypothetical protein